MYPMDLIIQQIYEIGLLPQVQGGKYRRQFFKIVNLPD